MDSEILYCRVPPELKEALVKAAEKERRSLSKQVTKALEDWLADRSRPDFLSESLNSGDGTYRP